MLTRIEPMIKSFVRNSKYTASRALRSPDSCSAIFFKSRNQYSMSKQNNSLILVGLGVTASALIARQGMEIYQDYMKRREESKSNTEEETGNDKSSSQASDDHEAPINNTNSSTGEKSSSSTSSTKVDEKSSGGINFDFLNMFGKNFYDGRSVIFCLFNLYILHYFNYVLFLKEDLKIK
jgi:hypothetical protein